MLFLVKRTDGILVKCCRPLEVITLASLETDPIVAITAADLDGVTVDQMDTMLRCLHVRTNAKKAGKARLVNHIAGTWDEITGMAMRHDGVPDLDPKGAPKVFLLQTDNGIVPVPCHSGQVFSLTFIRGLTPCPLTSDMLRCLTVDELKHFDNNIAPHPRTMGVKDKDGVIVRVIDAFEEMEGAVAIPIVNTPVVNAQESDTESSEEEQQSENENSEQEDEEDEALPSDDAQGGGKLMTIQIKLMGMTTHIPYYYKDGETFDEIAKKLPPRIGNKVGADFAFRIEKSYIEGWETASSIFTPEMNTLEIVPRIRGGGKSGVVKSKMKKSVPENFVRVNETHGTIFKNAYDMAFQISKSDGINFGNLVGTLGATELVEMREFLKSGKTKKALKVPKLVEYSPSFKTIKAVEDMLASTVHVLQEGLTTSVEKEFGNGKEIDFDKMLEVLNVAIGKAQGSESTASTAMRD